MRDEPRRLLVRAAYLIAALASVGCPEYRRQTGNAAITVGAVGAFRAALIAYRQQCGGFPAALAPIGPPEPGRGPSCERLDTLRPVVRAEAWGDLKEEMAARRVRDAGEIDAGRPVSGYRIQYRPARPIANGLFSSFEIVADPIERGVTGFWSFWASEAGEIHRNFDAPAGPKDGTLPK